MSGTSRLSSSSLVPVCVLTCSSYMRSLGVTLPPACMTLVKELPSRNLKKILNFANKLQHSTHHQLPQQIMWKHESKLWCAYNGNPGEGLNSLRYSRFCGKVATSTSHVQPQSLPPIPAATRFHSPRVHYQVQQWKGSVDELLLQNMGWTEWRDAFTCANWLATSSMRIPAGYQVQLQDRLQQSGVHIQEAQHRVFCCLWQLQQIRLWQFIP